MPTVLKGLRQFTRPREGRQLLQVTAIVTVADDGGSSGWLRRELAVLPPGDIRNCLVALSNRGHPLTRLFQYRFGAGPGLEGHTVGNLMLTALSQLQGDFLDAIRVAGVLLGARGRVLPSTLRAVQLVADLEDGRRVVGEQAIVRTRGKIKRIQMDPAAPPPSPGVLSAIERADLIVLGPGSLYSSVLPNLLVDGVARGVAESRALKVMVMNLMTEPGETEDMDGVGHVAAVLGHAGPVVDCVLAHEGDVPPAAARRYAERGASPVFVDEAALRHLGVGVVREKLILGSTQIRHDPNLLSQTLVELARTLRPRANA
jgi:uncharacterized cofD-like protein